MRILFNFFPISQGRLVTLIISVGLVGLTLSCTNSPLSMETDLREARERSNVAIAAHDTAAIARTLTADYHVITSRNTESTRSMMLSSLAADMQAKPDLVYQRNPEVIRIFSEWGMASEYGQWSGHWTEPDGGKVFLKGTYYAKWHLVEEKWLIRAEIFTPLVCSGEPYCSSLPLVKK